MNGRRVLRKYAQSLGKEAKEFVEIKNGYYGDPDDLITKSNSGVIEITSLNYKLLFHWMVKNIKNEEFR